MRILLTGAAGFLGWHTRARLRALTDHEVTPLDREDWPQLAALVRGADAVIHLAGVNRGSERAVEQGNVVLADQLAQAVRDRPGGLRVVFANSTQAGNGTAYGTGKAQASSVLARAVTSAGGTYADVVLPNLFGEHGRPAYNSFVATFAHAVVRRARPDIVDRPVRLLHAQRAAQVLIEAVTAPVGQPIRPAGTATTVQAVYQTLLAADLLYRAGDIPPLLTDLDLDLFNTLRAARFPAEYPIRLDPRIDHRGRLVETVRSHGGCGQTFVSTSKPGVTRGQHFHLRKVERFVVLDGAAAISLRRLFTEEVVRFDVDGEHPVAIDMPTMWAHNIHNTGSGALTTMFWTNELFDPTAPDTVAEPVEQAAFAAADTYGVLR